MLAAAGAEEEDAHAAIVRTNQSVDADRPPGISRIS
jgi:hypothetical protein